MLPRHRALAVLTGLCLLGAACVPAGAPTNSSTVARSPSAGRTTRVPAAGADGSVSSARGVVVVPSRSTRMSFAVTPASNHA